MIAAAVRLARTSCTTARSFQRLVHYRACLVVVDRRSSHRLVHSSMVATAASGKAAQQQEPADMAPSDAAAAKPPRSAKASPSKSATEADEPGPEPTTTAAVRKRKAKGGPGEGAEGSKAAAKPKKAPALPKEPVGTKYDEKTMRPDTKALDATRILSWNVAGLRALLKKDASSLATLVELEKIDVLCLQEHKLQEKNVEDVRELMNLSEEWVEYFGCSSQKLGYSGVATLCRKSTVGEPLSVTYGLGMPEHDKEGRLITVEFKDFYVCNAYVPNSGAKLERLQYRTDAWDLALSAHLLKLEMSKPVVCTGDLNIAREPVDIHNAQGNLKTAGFTPEERESFEKEYMGNFVDAFRAQHGEDVYGYTFFSNRFQMRSKGKGWRLDYHLVSQALAERCADCYILQSYPGSDHCPLGLVLRTR